MQNPAGKSALGLDVNVAAMLAYLPICAVNLIMSIIIIVTDKTNKLARFHAFQSLLIAGASFILGIALMILGGIVAVSQSTALGVLLMLFQVVVIFGIIGVAIFCMIKAYQGEMLKLPVIGDMADKWSN